MRSKTLLELERSIAALSLEEKLWLLERIAHQLRANSRTQPFDSETMEQALVEMANDPEIQAEIVAIDQAFAIAEMDGLQEI
jgi:hypothetical protein